MLIKLLRNHKHIKNMDNKAMLSIIDTWKTIYKIEKEHIELSTSISSNPNHAWPHLDIASNKYSSGINTCNISILGGYSTMMFIYAEPPIPGTNDFKIPNLPCCEEKYSIVSRLVLLPFTFLTTQEKILYLIHKKKIQSYFNLLKISYPYLISCMNNNKKYLNKISIQEKILYPGIIPSNYPFTIKDFINE